MPLPKNERIYANQNKEIMKKWDFDKNNSEGIYPEKFSENSHLPANFICPDCGNKWNGSIRDAGRYNGCKKCMNKARSISNRKTRLKRGKSLFETNPELKKEWDYEENNKIGLYPEEVMAGTPKEAHWICPLEHHYVAFISNRAKKHTGCKYCSGQEVLEGFNDLATTRKDLLKEWDYEENNKIGLYPNKVMRGNHTLANWICPVGHNYKKTIHERSAGHGCTECAKESQTSFPEQAIYFYMKKIFNDNVLNRYGKPEIDIFIPTINFGIEYDGLHSHKNKEEKEKEKNNTLKKMGIDLLRIKEVKTRVKDTKEIIYCEINSNYSYLNEVLNKLIIILKEKYNVITNIEINIEKDRIEIEEQYVKSLKENSILSKKPELKNEWDYEKNGKIKPEYVSYGSSKKYWWKCNLGHSYECEPKKKEFNKGCPYCSNKKLLKGFNDIKTLYPNVINDWDYNLNKNIPEETIGITSKHFYWKCVKGHSYYGTLNSKLIGSKCTICSGKQVLLGYNDLKSIYPLLAEEWDYKKNNFPPEHYAATSNKKVYWICKKCNHNWKASISNRPNCPNCTEINNTYNIYSVENGELLGHFLGIREVCKYLNIDYKKQRGNISSVCSRKQNTICNKFLIRKFIDDEYANMTLKDRKKEFRLFYKKKKCSYEEQH